MKKIIITKQNKVISVSGKAYYIDDGGLPSDYRELSGIDFDSNVWYNTGEYIYGSDTVRISFKATKSCNVFGCYSSASAQDNYSLYVSTSSSGAYLRYNGGTYNSYITTNTRYDAIITPTGSQGMKVNTTWNAKTFTTSKPFLIGSTSTGATSSKFDGIIYGSIIIDDRLTFIPVEQISTGKIGYFLLEKELFFENQGSGTPVEI